jgi:AraC-like DNA-binding protein
MLSVFLGGRGWYRRTGRETLLTAGMVGLVLPGEDVGLMMADQREPYDHFYCRFAGQEAMQLSRTILAERDDTPFAPHPAWQQAGELLGRMTLDPPRGDDPPGRLRPVDARLAEVLAVLARTPRPTPRRLSRSALLEYMRLHLASPADLDAMAEHFALSKPHLCRLAKPLLGQTIHRTWTAMKIDWARVLLHEASLSVAEVARRVGYVDAFYFSSVFRRLAGRSPSEERSAPAREGSGGV